MALTPGRRLGAYDVIGSLGAGGMGEVYRAKDTKLNRDVAVKILPDVFAHDTDRVAGFAREAQTLAALNHPHSSLGHLTRDEFHRRSQVQPTPKTVAGSTLGLSR